MLSVLEILLVAALCIGASVATIFFLLLNNAAFGSIEPAPAYDDSSAYWLRWSAEQRCYVRVRL